MVSRDSFHRAYYGGMLFLPQNAEKQHRALNSSEFPCLFSRNIKPFSIVSVDGVPVEKYQSSRENDKIY